MFIHVLPKKKKFQKIYFQNITSGIIKEKNEKLTKKNKGNNKQKMKHL